VDNRHDGADVVALLLTSRGHDVRVTYDGPSAVVAAREFRPHPVPLDLSMPGMDGYEVIRQLRQVPGCEAAVVVAVSGYGREEDRRHAREARFAAHLLKPVEVELLDALLDTAAPDAASPRTSTATSVGPSLGR
jgi:two-component system CheB/CheR fusion protein